MLLACTSKGCFDNNEHLLDPETNEVICLKCHRPIDVPNTTKKTLASLKQVRRVAPKTSTEFDCAGCGQISRPLIRKAGKTSIAVCRHCGVRFNINQFFVEALKMVKEEPADDEIQARAPAKKSGTKPSPRQADSVPALQPKPRQGSARVPKKTKTKRPNDR